MESLLFDAFIPAAYRHDPAGRWKAQDAERWLVFLARHLEFTIGDPDLAWWQLPLAVPGFVLAAGVVFGVAAGVVFGVVAGVVFGAATGVVFGAATGVVPGTVFARSELSGPVHGVRFRPPRRRTIMFGAATGAAIGATLGVVVVGTAGVAVAVTSGVVFTVIAGVGFGFIDWAMDQKGAPLDLSSAADPLTVLARDRRTATAFGFTWGVVSGTVAGLLTGATAGAAVGIVAGAMFGLVFGVASSFGRMAWPSYGLARIWLVLRRRLPWPLMGFLADAHRRGVLRQAGAVYQFRHIELQHRLANRDADSQQANPSFAAATMADG